MTPTEPGPWAVTQRLRTSEWGPQKRTLIMKPNKVGISLDSAYAYVLSGSLTDDESYGGDKL